MDPFRQRQQYVRNIGVVFGQRNQLLWDLPVRDTFLFHKRIYRLTDKEYKEKMLLFADFLDLGELLEARAMTLSLGQRMKCNLALSILHSPKILFLDEATIGLDVLVKRDIQNLLSQQIRDSGATLFFTSHDMKDIEQICNRIIVLDKGYIMEDMPLNDFINKYGGRITIMLNLASIDSLRELFMLCNEQWKEKADVIRADVELCQLQIVFHERKLPMQVVMEGLYARHIPIVQMQVENDQLEDAISMIYRHHREDK